MKKISLLALFLLGFVCQSFAQTPAEEAAMSVLVRATSNSQLPVVLNQIEGADSTFFEYEVKNGNLHISGSSPVALCRGFYDYAKKHGYGLYSWTGSSLNLPSTLENESTTKVTSPFEHHYYFNVVTYGYTMPYWDWERWEKELDWMALHGLDMPLSLIAYEAIIARVWKKMGLTDEEINSYFVGPAHLPWMRMGNISGINGPLDQSWYDNRIELQHKVLDRMKELGMKPIVHGFPGFIPQAFKRIHPELEISQTSWSNGSFHNWMISPREPLFSEISTMYVQEWEKEFGKAKYYLVDSFNEMDNPLPEKGNPERYELLNEYGDKVYKSIKAANPDAVWTMQGWMFGYQRTIWDYETLGALLKNVPDDKILLLDLAVDYNKHFWKSQVNWDFYKGFYNKPWVYSVIPNMGGKTGLTGVLEFYANGHLEALASPNRGKLVGHGLAPEGIENNEVIYELYTDAGWSSKEIDLNAWYENYSVNRYGSYPKEIRNTWKELEKSVYGTFTDHPRYNWQFRPGVNSTGTINLSDSFFKGIEEFASVAPEMKDSELYMADLMEFSALYLGGKAEFLVYKIEQAYADGDVKTATKLEADFEYILKGIDKILYSHPVLRLENWIEFARSQGVDQAQAAKYESNAKRLVTIWGPPVDDYAARVWSGHIRDYYLPRWQHYFASKKSGEAFDYAAWELDWVENSVGLSPQQAPKDMVAYIQEMMKFAKGI